MGYTANTYLLFSITPNPLKLGSRMSFQKSRTLCHSERYGVYAAGMGGKPRALPWEICLPALC